MNETSRSRPRRSIAQPLLASALAFAAAYGGPVTADDLAGAATNPLANLMQFQFQYQYNGGYHNNDDTSQMGVIQPVIPFKLPWASVPTLITRTTISYLTTPEIDLGLEGRSASLGLPDGGFVDVPAGLDGKIDSQSAWGDIVSFGLFLPKLNLKGQTIGIGPVVSLPLSSNKLTGTGKWELGPAAVYINTNTPTWQWGALAYHLWDVADSQPDRNYQSKTFFQPVLVKHFKKGWYVGSQDLLWSYDWRSEKWNLPLGVRIGKVTKIGKQPVNLFVEPIYQPVDDGVQMEWAVKLNVTLLFPQ
jgi:hypothetical protein